mmetsp:Transcript_17514/g.27048  ORF Transcript_17514/g.27048 Transcript_17514/m.27048 type:complete len:796 (+) Transcript_17514:120-2507(+)
MTWMSQLSLNFLAIVVLLVKPPKILADCDWNTDPCAFKKKYNSECDAGVEDDDGDLICPFESDCFDCSTDPCRALDFTGCEECTSLEGCSWCGKDSICASVPMTRSQFAQVGVIATCSQASYVTTCDAETNNNNVFNDPLYSGQSWIYDLIRIQGVWKDGITGSGIHIRINDRGVDHLHPDLADNFDTEASCAVYGVESIEEDHGTTCAAISAASANNNECAVGIAPNATLSSCRVLGEAKTPEVVDYQFLSHNLERLDISSNSWGIDACQRRDYRRRQLDEDARDNVCPFMPFGEGSPCTQSACRFVDWSSNERSPACESLIVDYCARDYQAFGGAKSNGDMPACMEFLDLFVSCEYFSLSESSHRKLVEGITKGRDGKGVIYVFASGNAYPVGEDTNFEGWLNTRFTIAVGAVGKRGLHASYSTTGAALFISAPGGDFEFVRGFLVPKPGGGCKDAGIGTSFAAPIISGVVALMLEVNPDLGWRDVQGILAATSQKTDPDDSSWTTNSAGFHHSYKYGFGLVDAQAAVQASRMWENYAPEEQIIVESGDINLLLSESEPNSTTLMVDTGDREIVAESVVVYIDLFHPSRGDLEIILTSPSGTESILHPSMRPETSFLPLEERWKLMTVRNWDESAKGEWTLSVHDQKEGDSSSNCVDNPDWHFFLDTYKIDCSDIGKEEICVDGGKGPNWDGVESTLRDAEEIDKVQEACCECGGGLLPSEFPDILVAWTLVVYGREVPITSPPSSQPSSSPTDSSETSTVDDVTSSALSSCSFALWTFFLPAVSTIMFLVNR